MGEEGGQEANLTVRAEEEVELVVVGAVYIDNIQRALL